MANAATQVKPGDDFDAAFSLAANDKPLDEEDVAAVAEPAAEEADDTAKTVDTEGVEDVPSDAGDAPAEEADAGDEADDAAEPAAEEVKQPAKEELKTVAGESSDELLRKFSEILDQKAPPKAEEKPAEAQQEQKAPELYTADELATLDQYQKDWPDVAKAEALVRRGEYQQIVSHIFSEVMAQLGPMQQMLQSLAERTHLSDLHDRVGDYDDVRDKVIEWVGQQPTYLQEAFTRVINTGTVDEVADLIQRFKADNGMVEQSNPEPAPKETELPAEARKAAVSLAPVSSKRSAVPQKGEDRNDFDSAFARFAKEVMDS